MRVLIVDNYDSFTYNLHQLLGELGARPRVIENDRIDLEGIRALAPSHLVLSPGPGTPERASDVGISARVITELAPTIPTLGVCLGHQVIVHELGGRIVRAPRVMHGKTSRIRCREGRLFAGLPGELEVMRYHSLVAERATLPECLRVTAETEDGVLMAVEHAAWPLFGVQFHPESIGTPLGPRIVASFLATRAAPAPSSAPPGW